MQTVPNHSQVLIAGAGPCGMTLALTLARAGHKPTIVDKRPRTREYSQALVLWPRTLEALDMLGIAESWREKSTPISTFRLSLEGRSTPMELEPVHGPYPYPWAVGQDVTEQILEAEVRRQGIPLLRPVEVTAVALSERGATVTVTQEGEPARDISCDWVVGCEGSHSVVREAAHIARRGGKNPVQLIQGDVRLRGPLALAPGNAFLFSDGTQDTLLVMPTSVDGHYRVLVTAPDNGSREPVSLAELQGHLQSFIPGMEAYDPTWLNRFRVQHQIADTFRKGRALIAGDTAHVWVPIGGQGMNIAMQDAFDLGWKLGGVVQGELKESVLDTFTAERRPIGEATIALTEQVYDAMLNPQGLKAHLQRWLLPLLADRHRFVAFMSERLGQADFAYSKSELVVSRGEGGRVQAGQRAPDATVQTVSGPRRLYELLRSGHWLVLAWVTEEDDSARDVMGGLQLPARAHGCVLDTTRRGMKGTAGDGVATLRDVGHIALHNYGVKGSAIYVVRPDGVVGYSGHADRARVQAYLDQIFVQTNSNRS